jgi:hypothetical protein
LAPPPGVLDRLEGSGRVLLEMGKRPSGASARL